MPPVHPIELAAISAGNLVEDVLGEAAIEASTPMQAALWQTPERPSLDEARTQDFVDVKPPVRWGPVWSTAWFRLRGVMPEGDGTPALRFSSGTEALVHLPEGTSHHGFDMNRDLARLPATCTGELELFVEAACNRPLGATLFWWDPPEDHARWKEDRPGRFDRAQLVRVHEPTWALAVTLDFARRLLLALPREAPETAAVHEAIARAIKAVDDVDPRRTSPAVLERLKSDLAGHSTGTEVIAVGHAHIDTAWLWPVAETRRKVRRSWATALAIMDRFEDFCFTASQTQQYAWLEEDDPDLLARIGEQVTAGRWEVQGGMWVEPDCQVPSGESLIRQLLVGTAWWKRRFPDAPSQSVLYLPDTFGFPASLPQIIDQAGLSRFVTNKICWNEVTEFPHVDFDWRGIDGTTVAAHFTPGHNYNAQLEPKDLIGAQANAMADGPGRSDRWIQPFGFGDGGGGPTDEMALRAQLSGSARGLPRVVSGRLDSFERTGSGEPALWDGELYLEMHRGTFTAQGWLKRANLACEESLRLAEILSWCDAPTRIETRRALERAWQLLLLQQFHDILPGSSIGVVYEDARRDIALVQAEAASRIDALFEQHGEGGQAHVFNPASTERAGVVDTPAGPMWHQAAPPLGTAPMQNEIPDGVSPVSVQGLQLDNGLLSCRIGSDGAVHDLFACGATRPVAGPLCELAIYRDRPRRWEAWDIDRDYEDLQLALAPPASVEVVEASSLKAVIEVRRDIDDASAAVLRYTLRAGSPMLEVAMEIDWAQSHRLLRCRFQTDIRSTDALMGIQFGHVRRAMHRNMPFDEARFEVPGHRWMDCSEPGRGLAVLDRGIYGKSAHNGTLGLSLLRGTMFPDPDADRGVHQLHWALLPHQGDPLVAQVPAHAEAFAGRGPLPNVAARVAPFELSVSAPAMVEIAACKGAEDGKGRILRLVEMHGAHGRATLQWPTNVSVQACDLHEAQVESEHVQHSGTVTTVDLRPFGITTLRIEDDA
ncbi:MAG: glycosyl hydrolase-related protein [Phycisphaerales bacterium]|nr:glycosyl hydrolase-related protein [Phycisphaerales bacterium]